ncbi:hypothetical protein BZA05DRAFT_390454 [Tricharina praecox]|uniref:uncharacterized protein n=1 Tax=Tricharina praecox TaxID=43433 RepID=UPI002220ADD6|nr:uncharacterized protein BZA05DRAFT_390454 [Tricharina praecox]KAI5856041.1 hypothetical protein BZA05DRAFT_390454 [Tricharina praecox]
MCVCVRKSLPSRKTSSSLFSLFFSLSLAFCLSRRCTLRFCFCCRAVWIGVDDDRMIDEVIGGDWSGRCTMHTFL